MPSHPMISRGLCCERRGWAIVNALAFYTRIAPPRLAVVGIDTHCGSVVPTEDRIAIFADRVLAWRKRATMVFDSVQ